MRWPTSPSPRSITFSPSRKNTRRGRYAKFLETNRFCAQETILRLRAAVLGGEEGDFSLSTFDGGDAQFRDVYEVLSTVSMFGGGKRLVVVEGADEFVTRYRPQLEDYVARPSRAGVLVLNIESLPGNTRLYKSIAAAGLLIDCALAAAAGDKVAGRLGQAAS